MPYKHMKYINAMLSPTSKYEDDGDVVGNQ